VPNAEEEEIMAHQYLLSDEMRKCIQDCIDCNRICTETVTHCITMGGKHVQADHLRTLLDCAEICATATGFMLRASDYVSAIIRKRSFLNFAPA